MAAAPRVEGAPVVVEVRAVGGADLVQPGAAPAHDVGNAEGAADLDQLPARDGHVPPGRQRVEREDEGAGRIVDHQGVFGSGQAAEALATVVGAAAARAGIEVQLQVAVPRRDRGHGLDGRRRQWGAAEVGMEHDAAGVEHGPEAGTRAIDEALPDLRRPILGRARAPDARGGERLANGSHDGASGRGQQQGVYRRLPKQPVHGWQLPAGVAHVRFLVGSRLSESAAPRRTPRVESAPRATESGTAALTLMAPRTSPVTPLTVRMPRISTS